MAPPAPLDSNNMRDMLHGIRNNRVACKSFLVARICARTPVSYHSPFYQTRHVEYTNTSTNSTYIYADARRGRTSPYTHMCQTESLFASNVIKETYSPLLENVLMNDSGDGVVGIMQIA